MLKGLKAGSFPIVRIWRTQIRVHFLFVVWIGYRLATAKNLADLEVELLFQGVLFGSVLLHEFGHVAGARRMGLRAEEVILWPLGGLAAVERARSAKAELVATGGGPLVNLLLLGLALLLMALAPGPGSLGDVLVGEAPAAASGALGVVFLRYLFLINLLLFAFNVIPAYPLDGGTLLRGSLWALPKVSWRTATLIATVGGMICGLGFVGVAVLAQGFEIFRALIGVMVVVASFQEYQRAKSFRMLPSLDDDRMPFEGRGDSEAS